jgi:threonine dehydrogenase-like Zn-dependent dehydrogenase
MKALTFTGVESVTYTDVADPEIISPEDVIVKVKCCAICGSDLHVYHGRETGLDYGTCMGHEFAGEIVEKGKNVKAFSVGDQIISPFTASCGSCFFCQTGLTSRCIHSQLFGWVENGMGLHGGQAEFIRVPLADSTLIKLSEGVSLEEGVLVGDNIPTGFYCAGNARVQPKGTYVVVGCGPVGLMAIVGARELGAQHILAIDKVPARLQMALDFGATPIDAGKDDAVDVVKDATEGRGADAVLEAIGSEVSLKLAYDLARPGGILSSVGVCTGQYLPFSPVQVYNKNLTFISGRCPARALMPTIIPLVQQKKYTFNAVISHRMALSEGVKAYDIFAGKKDNCLKVMLAP